MKRAAKIILYIWQLPQNIVGYFMSRAWKNCLINLTDREKVYLYGLEELTGYKIYISEYYSHKNNKVLGFISGGSFGLYICLNSAHDLETLKHEKGHGGQSKRTGPIYLFIIGAPSAAGNLLARKFEWFRKNYYNLPWEAWADKLGGVKRINQT